MDKIPENVEEEEEENSFDKNNDKKTIENLKLTIEILEQKEKDLKEKLILFEKERLTEIEEIKNELEKIKIGNNLNYDAVFEAEIFIYRTNINQLKNKIEDQENYIQNINKQHEIIKKDNSEKVIMNNNFIGQLTNLEKKFEKIKNEKIEIKKKFLVKKF